MRSLACVAAAATLALSGCAQDSPAQSALESTEENLPDIRSGVLSMQLLAAPAGAAEGRGVGFELRGPFAVAEETGSLPAADLQYTRVTGAERRSTRFISTGKKAFVEVDGRTYELAEEQVEDLRAQGGEASGKGGLEGLHLDEWIEDPRLRGGAALGGIRTDTVTGRLDPVPALNDLLELALNFGASEEDAPRRLEGEAANRVRRAVRATEVELTTGSRDRLLRRLRLRIDLGVEDEPGLRRALGRLAGARLTMELGVDRVNSAVTVREPARSRPASELESG